MIGLALALLACAADPATDPTTLVLDRAWRDEEGRALLHRGMNVSTRSKSTPDLLTGWSDETLALLPATGITLARYLVFWQGIEPEPGQYDEAYLDGVVGEVERLHAQGLAVMIDVHQDVYGAGFDYTGFPRWTCDSTLYESFEHNPGGWALDYLAPEVIACFDQFWASATLQESYAEAVAHLADRLGDSVVGYELMNEPYWGSHAQEEFETGPLAAFYANTADAVLAVAPQAWIAVEPSAHTNLTGTSWLVVPDVERVLFAPHFYPIGLEGSATWDGELDVAWLDGLSELAADRDAPLWLSEFGAVADDAGMVPFAHAVLDNVEANRGSTAYWAFDPGYVLQEDLTPGPMLDAWRRPFPAAVPGNIVAVERSGAGFVLRWADPGDGEPVVVVVPEGACTTLTVDGVAAAGPRVEIVGQQGENSLDVGCE